MLLLTFADGQQSSAQQCTDMISFLLFFTEFFVLWSKGTDRAVAPEAAVYRRRRICEE